MAFVVDGVMMFRSELVRLARMRGSFKAFLLEVIVRQIGDDSGPIVAATKKFKAAGAARMQKCAFAKFMQAIQARAIRIIGRWFEVPIIIPGKLCIGMVFWSSTFNSRLFNDRPVDVYFLVFGV